MSRADFPDQDFWPASTGVRPAVTSESPVESPVTFVHNLILSSIVGCQGHFGRSGSESRNVSALLKFLAEFAISFPTVSLAASNEGQMPVTNVDFGRHLG